MRMPGVVRATFTRALVSAPFCCPHEDGGDRRPRLPLAAMQRAKALNDAQRMSQAVPGVVHAEVLVGNRHDAVDYRSPVPSW